LNPRRQGLGQEVAAGDVLVELVEGGEQRDLLQEQQAQGAALGGQIEVLRRQIASGRSRPEPTPEARGPG
jgi:hypothetical protein